MWCVASVRLVQEKLAQRRTFGVTDDATTGLVENASYNKVRFRLAFRNLKKGHFPRQGCGCIFTRVCMAALLPSTSARARTCPRSVVT